MKDPTVLYVYRCVKCGHRGETHFPDDGFDGAPGTCSHCHAAIIWEWDGGVDLKSVRKEERNPL